jgi:hypothetical protein
LSKNQHGKEFKRLKDGKKTTTQDEEENVEEEKENLREKDCLQIII